MQSPSFAGVKSLPSTLLAYITSQKFPIKLDGRGNWGKRKLGHVEGEKMTIGTPKQELSTAQQHGFCPFRSSHRPSHMPAIRVFIPVNTITSGIP